jgi:hypothetical protein
MLPRTGALVPHKTLIGYNQTIVNDVKSISLELVSVTLNLFRI